MYIAFHAGDPCINKNSRSGDNNHGNRLLDNEDNGVDTEDEGGQSCDYEPGLEFDDTELEHDKNDEDGKKGCLNINDSLFSVLFPLGNVIKLQSNNITLYATDYLTLHTSLYFV